jgi:hypothetical protein
MGIADRQHRSDNHQDATDNVVNNALLAKLARKVSDSGLKASFVWQ